MKKNLSRSFLDIDMLRLDQECQSQPLLYHEYAMKLTDAKADRDQARAALDVVKAEIYLAASTNPDRFGLVKTTEASLNAVVTAHEKVRNAVEAEIEASRSVGIYDAAVKALDNRKRALEDIVKLHLSDYYSPPRIEPKREGENSYEDRLAKRRAARAKEPRTERTSE